jgi:cytochrome c-type biogenesis protein CcmH
MRMLRRAIGLVALAALGRVGVPSAALAALVQGAAARAPLADSIVEARTREVASTLRCPACEDVSIEDSPADLARDMKQVVHDKLAAGETPDDVRQYFVDRYGEWVVLRPRASVRTAALWLVPGLGILAAGWLIVTMLGRWTRAAQDAPGAAEAIAVGDRSALAARRESLLAAMRELEADHADGKVSAADFEEVRGRDARELATIDGALRREPPSSPLRSSHGRRASGQRTT